MIRIQKHLSSNCVKFCRWSCGPADLDLKFRDSLRIAFDLLPPRVKPRAKSPDSLRVFPRVLTPNHGGYIRCGFRLSPIWDQLPRTPRDCRIQQPFVMCAHTSPALRRCPVPLESSAKVRADFPARVGLPACPDFPARLRTAVSAPRHHPHFDSRFTHFNSLINASLYPVPETVPKIGGGL